ncbi:MAG: hypothetical protein IIY70_01415 [Oscillospiraceae bacterium]|nr:hypothetical protein [Oscillospiraceae bacterium]
MKRYKDLKRLSALLLAVMTVLLAIALCWAAVDIWLQGSIRRRADPTTVIYSVEAVHARAILVLPVFLLWLVSLAVRCCTASSQKSPAGACPRQAWEPVPVSPALRHLRYALFALAVLLIVLGILNGGLQDVLTKAVNLCTECIGLG